MAVFDPQMQEWQEWRLPGQEPHACAVYVDQRDIVWLSAFAANALVRFDPDEQRFELFALPGSQASGPQIHRRPGEVSGVESGADKLIVIRSTGR